MPFIYKITNTINQKSYVGKTIYTVEKRWKEHCKDSLRTKMEKRPLYNAMKKYGIDNFSVEPLEECSTKLLDEREKYWIEYLDTYHNGYNATMGGDGALRIDREAVIKAYQKYRNMNQVATILNISSDSVKNILLSENIELQTLYPNSRKIKMFNKFGDYIKTFESCAEASRWLLLNCKNKCKESGLRSHILDVCNNKRKSVYGYRFVFI